MNLTTHSILVNHQQSILSVAIAALFNELVKGNVLGKADGLFFLLLTVLRLHFDHFLCLTGDTPDCMFRNLNV